MKYRIIQRFSGYYQVQYKEGFFKDWQVKTLWFHSDNVSDKYSEEERQKFCNLNVFPTLELALATYQRLIEQDESNVLKDTYKVIKIKETPNVKSKTCC